MDRHTIPAQGARVPRLLYGTAWKEDATRDLVGEALAAGFRGVDTANQRKHYHEAQVGEAVRAALDAGLIARELLFVQTKYTFAAGQDARLPYDPRAPIGEQVAQSHASSLTHLGLPAVDSYLLHAPSRREGLGPDDHAAWRAMEAIHDAGGARILGVSNVSAAQLRELLGFARIPPAVVQNRCYSARDWDAEVRGVCAENGLVYQGFSLLTANPHVWQSGVVTQIGHARGLTPAQVVLRYALERNMVAVTGTTSAAHMAEDLAILGRPLDPAEVAAIAEVC